MVDDFRVKYSGYGSFLRQDGSKCDRGWYIFSEEGVPRGPYFSASDAYRAGRDGGDIHLANLPRCRCGARHFWGQPCPLDLQ